MFSCWVIFSCWLIFSYWLLHEAALNVLLYFTTYDVIKWKLLQKLSQFGAILISKKPLHNNWVIKQGGNYNGEEVKDKLLSCLLNAYIWDRC